MASIPNKQIVGLGFQIGVGKDAVADVLVSQYDFTKFRFADALKEAVCTIYGWRREQLEDSTFKMTRDPFWGTTPREILQRFGTEACRDVMDQNIWVRALERRIRNSGRGRIVIPDVRFENEVAAIKNWGGHTVHITRPGWKPPGAKSNQLAHASETELLGYSEWDYTIDNSGTLDDLRRHVAFMCHCLL